MATAKGRRKADEEAAELTKKDLDGLKKALLEERARVLSRLDSHVTQATEDRDNLADEMDMATRHSDQAYLLRLADKEHKLLAEIDHALAKFEHGTFGVCEGTGEPIELRRLEIRPWTRYSLEYKEQLEREKGNRAGR
ncbi:MAG: TraR/DksA C4-type zinc finger protein [Clostridia bacterium]|nr:TraR/DksA C4-type zinc finger protein [Deltaproteobacteria bacterium]